MTLFRGQVPRFRDPTAIWLVLATIAVPPLAILAIEAPSIAFGLIAGIAALCVGIAAPRLFFALGMIAVLLERTLALHIGGVADSIDEAFVGACVVLFAGRRLIERKPLRSIPGQIPILLFILTGAISSVVHAVPVSIAAQGVLLIAKGFLLAWAVAQLHWDVPSLRNAIKLGAISAVVLIIGAAINLAIPTQWSNIVLGGVRYGERFGLTPVTSFFQHPGYFGTVMSLAVLAALAYQSVFRWTKTSMFIIVGGIAAAFLTARRKILVGLVAGWATIGVRVKLVPTLVFVTLAVPIVAIVLGNAIGTVVAYTYAEYFEDPDAVARIRLTIDSVGYAVSSFPFGVGFGRFGSAVARQYYSPLYYDLGYPSVWGLGPTAQSGAFLTDTFWPAIIGETGFLGTAFFVVALFAIARTFYRMSRTRQMWDRWLGLAGLAWTVQLTIESIAGAVFTAVPTFALFFALVGIAVARNQLHGEEAAEHTATTENSLQDEHHNR